MKQNCFSETGLLSGIRKLRILLQSVTAVLVPSFLFWTPVYSNPRGGVVVHGDVQFSGTGGNLQIRQNSRNAIINWEDFSIDAGELTQFRQPNSSAAVLNRVTGGNPTAIHGALRANGNVFVINPNGILIGAGGTIDVHGLVLSTLDVSNGEFLAGGDMVFKGDSDAGVTNMGRINGIGGDVFLIGKTVTNSGSITAAGTVGLGAGEEVLLTAAENANGERMFVRSTGSGVSGTGVLNDGTIEGAAVELKAHGNIYALAINNKGSIRATGATNRGGSVFLEGVGGSVENRGSIEAYSSGSSNVASVLINAAYAKVDGQIRANSLGRGGQVKIAANDTVEISGAVNVSSADGTGGDILVEASDIVVDSTAEIDASGTAGGGLVRIGGGFQGRDEGVLNADSLEVKSGSRIFADAIESGDGGQVILWSDELTRFSGEIFARGSSEAAGGFVEVSGKNSFSYSGMVDTGGGTLLLDPSNITITDHAGTPPHTEFNRIDRDDLELALLTQNVVISTQSTETEEGWIQVTGDVNWSSDFNLSLLAEDDIYIQSSLRSSELGGVNLIAGWDSTNTSFLTGTPGSRPYSVPLPSGDVDMQAVFSDPTIYGNDSNADGGTRAGDSLAGFGSIFIGRDEAGALSSADLFVGSRRGETNVAAHGLYVNRADSNVAAQLGYGSPGAGAATGAITAQVKNGGVTLDAGDSNGAYAQIGHGGLNFGFDKSGVITVKSGNGVSLTGGLHSGGSAYAQIGHGGMNSDGEVGSSAVSDVIVEAGSGAVSLTGGGAVGSSAHYNYAKIGHGGDFVDSAVVGNVTVSGNGVTLAAGGFGDASAGSRFASAQIGHGGREAGPGSGNITVDAGTGNLSVLAGVAGVDFNNAQIGHGGAFRVEGDLDGAVRVTANHIDVVGGGRSQSFARIGHGGWTQGPHTGDRSGDIFVQADGELSVDAGNGVAEIGHHTGTGNLLNANVTVVAASADETAGDATGSDFEVGSSFADVMERNLAGGDVSLHATGAGGMTIAPGAAMSYSSDNDFSLLSENDLIVEGRIQNSGTGNANLVAGWNPAAAGLADPATGMIADIDMDADIFGNASSYGNNGGAVTISNAAGAASFGSLSGETNVAADSVTLTGTGSGFAQIGFSDHGDGNGNITVHAKSNVSLAGGPKYDNAHAQIGHGGYQRSGDKGGDISVVSGSGVSLMADQVGTGRFGFAQIGHGGRGRVLSGSPVPNEYSGDIIVDGGSGSVDLIAGQNSTSNAFRQAHIGHGGSHDSLGNFSGNIRVTGTHVNLDAGPSSTNYARVGHGGWVSGVNTGTRTGDIYVAATGEVSIEDPAGGGVAAIGHHNEDAAGTIFDANVTIKANSMDDVFGASGGNVFQVSNFIGNMLQDDLAAGDVSLHATGAGGILFDATGDVVFTSANDFNILSESGIQFESDVQNGGAGNINVVAGWNSAVAGLADPLTGIIADVNFSTGILGVAGSFANNGGAVALNATSRSAEVGSRAGQTNVAANRVSVNGSDTSVNSGAQIGFSTTTGSDSTGEIVVHTTTGGVLLSGGDAEGGFARIGHGGENRDGNADAAITVQSVGSITLASGAGVDSAAQIGHGGYASDGFLQGELSVVSSDGEIRMAATEGGIRSFVQIGHGGVSSGGGDKGGEDGMGNLDQITVSAADDIVLLGGGSDAAAYQQHQAYAMIGNGGYEADADTADDTGHRADITVHAGTDGTGSVILRGTGTPNNGDDAFVLIGNGGGRAGGDHSGDISVTAADDVLIHLGKDYRAFSQIGHGGYDADDFGTGVGHSGTIDVTATNGTVQLSGTPFVSSPYFISGNAYSQIGHGGINADGNHTGDITVLAGDRVLLNGGSGDNNSKQIGHGGHYAKGDFSGSVSVRATNNIELRGGTNDRTTAQIGHGGYEADGNHQADFIDVISDQGAIVVNAGKVNGFDNNLGNAVGIYAQIGLGGVFASGNMSAPVTVSANGNITMNAGGNYYAYSQIGNGGWEAFGDKSGVVSVTSNAGEISMAAAGRAHDTYAQIGHGGTRVDGTLRDDVTVSAANGVEILGGRREAVGSYAQVGHGGLEAVGNKSGVITLNSDSDGNGSGNLTVTGGSAEKAYALVGHGGIAADGFIDGLINVNVGGILDISGGSGAASGNEGNFNFGQIGHSLAGAVGGFGGFTERDGKIVVEGEMFTGSNSSDWFVVTPDTPIVDLVGPEGFYQNARGDSYAFQRQGGGTGGPGGGDEITFSFTTDGVGGEYRFYPRWTGYDGGSDSIFFNIEEVSDGAGGEPDWVEYAGNADRNFATPGWYTTGGVEINNASATPQSAVLWNLAPNTTYTMRVSVREDGVGVDAFVLQKSGMADPVGAGPGVTFTNASGVSGASDINVTAGGNINLTGGANSDAYAAIGHGGSHFGGVNSNLQYGSAGDGVDISVTSTGGNILLDGNSSAPDLAGASRRYATIGHHGVDAGFDAYGDVEVHAEAGTVTLRGGEAQDSFAAIGHSGGGVFLDHSSVRQGEICVVGVNGIDLGVSGNGVGNYVQIGHGGIGVAGDLGGDITAVAPSGAVAVTAGTGAGQYAQIGHGGVDADGALSGNVNVVAGAGSMALTGGGAADAYAMIGHGDGAGTSEGTRQGGIHLFSSGQITAADGSSEAHLFHQTGGDLQTGDYTGGDGLQLVANGGLAVSDASLRGVNEMIAGNWNQGPISLAFSNDIDLEVRGNSFDVATSDDFYLMTGGSIVMEAGYQNSLDGDVFLVAGWNGSGATFNGTVTYSGGDFCLPEIAVGQATFDFNTCANFGNNNGDVLIGNANQASGVAVGSRQGINGAGAYGLTLQASNSTEDSHTQFGFRTNGSGQATGAIDLNLKQGGLFLNAGDAGDGTATGGSYVQIGHGGLGADADGTDAAISISFCEPGEVRADGGNGFNAYAMIGSGGNSLNQDNAGTITVSNALQVDLNAGRGNRSGAQVGHGGYDADGSHNGDIEIGAANFIDVTAGFGQRSAGQIGHGGYGDNVGANTGDISLSTTAAGAGNGIHLVAGSSTVGANTASYAHIGHGGYASAANQSGDISLDSAGNITMTGGNRDLNYKQIGHGGRSSTAAAYGAINLSADGNIDLIGGTNDYDYAQVGHGGAGSTLNKSAAAVGTSGAPDGINVSSGGAIRVFGGDQNGDAHDGRFAYAQIGMGGANSGGPFNGDVTVSAQNGVEISGGGRDHNYARIGHGGDKETLSPNTKIGNINVTTATGDIALKGGTNHELTSATIGHGGFRVRGNSSGMIEVHAQAGKVTLLSGGGDDVGGQNTFGDHSYSSAQIGHGGSEITLVDGSETLSGEICVVGLAGVELHSDGDGDRAFTQIGHGGYNAHGDFDGEINVVAPDGSVLLNGGDAGAEGQYAQIGHGGISAEGTFSSDITVVAGNGDTVLAGGDADNSYAMIGNGDGAKTSLGDREGGIHLFSSGQLSGTNGGGTGSEVWIFHQNNNGLQPGEYLGGDGYQKIANGGITLPGGALADETTIINGNLGTGLIQILDSNSNNDYVIDASNIGISEIDSANDFFIITGGNITMLTSFQNSGSGDVTLVAGWNGSGTPAAGSVDYGNPVNFCDPAISDGGFTVDFNNCSTFGNNGKTITLGNSGQTDSIVVGSRGGTTTLAAHGVDVIAGNSDDAFTQVGFRPTATSGGTTGNIALHLKEGGLDLISATNASHSFAQIGHGGTGAHNSVLGGDIRIDFCAPGDINLTANQGARGDGSYAQIGHGGNNWDDAKSGNITIDGASNITLMGGRQNGYAQIGHGGSKDSSGSYGSGAASGNISVLNTAGKVSLLGGSGSENGYVQIGNGGIAMNGATSGNVTVHAGTGGIEMRGGDGNRSSALIGNGGYNNNQPVSGDVSVVTTGTGSADGILMQGGTGTSTGVGIGNGNYLNGTTIGGDTTIGVASGGLTLRGGSGQYSYGYIGHGSRDDASTMSGDVTLTIDSGELLVAAGTHSTASAIIGHGGFGESGSKLGDITINVAGDITVGDVNSLAFSQIGHGGLGSTGPFVGDIAISSTSGSIALIGGDADGIYAQIGHGGAGVTGSALGDIFLNVDPVTFTPGSGVDVSLIAGAGTGSYAQIGHGGVGATGNKTGDIAIGSIGDMIVMAGAEDLAYALIGHGGVEADGFLDGGISLDIGGNIDLAGGGTAGDSSDGEMNFAMIGHSLEGVRGGFGNLVEEGGRIVGEAEWFNATDNWVVRPEGYYPVGWTGSPAPPAHTFSGSRNGYFLELPDGNPAGAASSNSYVHYTFTTGSSGGSYRLNMRWTGFNGNSDSLFADIVEVKDGAGGEADYYNFASTTGGFGTFGWHSGATAEASSGGDSSNPPVWNLAANTTYTLRINPREDGVAVDSWMLVNNATGSFNGDAGVTFANKSGIGGGDITVNSGGNITVNSGINSDAFAAIGHGGSSHQTPGGLSYGSAADSADVFVHADGGIVLDAGANPGDTAGASNRYAVIGHHGVDADFEAFGNVTVEAGAGGVTMSSGNAIDSFAQIGHASNRESGGGTSLSRQGDVSVSTTGVINMLAGSFDGGHVQIGHGGSRVTGMKAGAVDVVSSGLNLIGGSGVSSYAQIGHGGEATAGDMSGDVLLSVAGDVGVSAGDGDGAYAMVGHGGGSSSGNQDGRIQVSSDALRIAAGTGERSSAQIGHGGNSSSGTKNGDIDVTADNVDLLGGAGDFARAAIGHGGNDGVGDISGEMDVSATVGGVFMLSGDGRSSGTQTGHGGASYGGSVVDQSLVVFSQAEITMIGGSGLNSSSHIGHGGSIANSPDLSGRIDVTAGGDVSLISGSEINSYTQIGNGGSSVDGNFSGDVSLESGGAIVLSSDGTTGAYSKIGHGDDLGAPALSGTGDRAGNIEVSAESDITMTDAMIGHVNATSNSTSSGGSTQIGVAGSAPADQTAGALIADADSVFQGQDGLRFYMPRRENNQISAGATLNGVSFAGAQTDPSETQRIDEFTINILGDQILFPNEHASAFGTGPAPQNPGNFAFYYDTIVLVNSPDPSSSENTGSSIFNPVFLPFFDLLFPDDRTTDDWQRKRRKDFTSYKSWSTYYEGFEQYGLYGDSIFSAGIEKNPDSEEEGL